MKRIVVHLYTNETINVDLKEGVSDDQISQMGLEIGQRGLNLSLKENTIYYPPAALRRIILPIISNKELGYTVNLPQAYS